MKNWVKQLKIKFKFLISVNNQIKNETNLISIVF